jgi:Secretion system C-terminal sorting domain
VEMQYDYRQIYSSILRDWMGVQESAVVDVFNGNFFTGDREEDLTKKYDNLTVASDVITGVQDNFIGTRFELGDCFPNPAKESTSIKFKINNTNHVNLSLLDNTGSTVKVLLNEQKEEGEHTVNVTVSDLPSGIYFYKLKTGFVNETKKMIITH